MTESVKIIRNGVKAEVLARYLPDFERDGWVKNEPVYFANSEIEGLIKLSESKDEIESLIKDVYQVDIDKRGNIETVREKALAVIRNHAE